MAIDFNLAQGNTDLASSLAGGFNIGAGIRKNKEEEERKRKEDLLFERLMTQMQDPNFQLSATTDFASLQRIAPDVAKAAESRFLGLSKKRQDEYIMDFQTARDAVARGDASEAQKILQDRIMRIEERGGSPDDSIRALSILESSPDAFIQGVDGMVAARYNTQLLDPSKTAGEFAPEISPIQVDPDTGQQYVVRSDRNTGQSQRINIENGKALTPDEKIAKDVRKEMTLEAVKRGNTAFDQISGVESNISTLEKAVSAIDAGAGYGVVENLMPAYDKATIELRQLARQLGLDVIGSVTFGALSEGELKLAMETAVPPLDEKDLKGWFQERIDAQKKLRKELTKMARELGSGKVTIPEYLEKNMMREEPKEDEFAGFSIK